jgi:hypothetical protein
MLTRRIGEFVMIGSDICRNGAYVSRRSRAKVCLDRRG